MFYKIESQFGHISFEKAVIGKIVIETVASFGGKIVLANKKKKMPGFVAKIGGKEDAATMEFTWGENGLDIRIFIMIRFGNSISRTTERLIQMVKSGVEEQMDVQVNSVAVVVTGMFSKQIAARNIEVRG